MRFYGSETLVLYGSYRLPAGREQFWLGGAFRLGKSRQKVNRSREVSNADLERSLALGESCF